MISAKSRYHIKYRKPGKRKDERGQTASAHICADLSEKTAMEAGKPGHGEPPGSQKEEDPLPEPHRSSRFTLCTNRVFLCIMKRTIRRPVFGMEGIISGFFDFSIDGLDDFTNLLYPFLVVFNYELCFFYPWMQDEPV